MLTAGCVVSQCADIASMARGRGNSAPRAAKKRVVTHAARAIIGEPCERNKVGHRFIVVTKLSALLEARMGVRWTYYARHYTAISEHDN